MSNKRKGFLVQFLGLPNSGKTSRINQLELEILKDKKIDTQKLGNLSKFSLSKIIENPFIYYEFQQKITIPDLIDQQQIQEEEQQKTKYTIKELQKENEAKIQDEIDEFGYLKQTDIIPLLHSKQKNDKPIILTGYNPLQQTLIHRYKVLEPNQQKFKNYKKQIDLIYKNLPTINIYLDATPEEVAQRQKNDGLDPTIMNMNYKELKMLISLGYQKRDIQKRIETMKIQSKRNLILTEVYQEPTLQNYLKKARTELLKYAKATKAIILSNEIPPNQQNEIIYDSLTARLRI